MKYSLPPGSLLVHPFLPTAASSSSVCQDLLSPSADNETSATALLPPLAVTASDVEVQPNLDWFHSIPDLAWPFIIIAFGNLFTAFAFLILGNYSSNTQKYLSFSAMIGLPMPHFYETVRAPHLLDIGQVNAQIDGDSLPNTQTLTG